MHLEASRRLIEERSFPDPTEIHPCSPEEVVALEAELGQPLPEALREFLLWCGKGLGEIWSGNRCFDYDDLLLGRGVAAARERLRNEGHDLAPMEGAVLVLQYDECDQFAFVRLDEGVDPPVYGRGEGEGVKRVAARFSDYVEQIVRQEFGLEVETGFGGAEGMGGEAEGASGAGAVAVPSVLPAEFDPGPDLMEGGDGSLPETVQQAIGPVRASFVGSRANIFAAVVFGVLFLCGSLGVMGLAVREVATLGYALPGFSAERMSWTLFGTLQGVGIGMAIGGVLCIRQALRWSGLRTFVGDRGVCRERKGRYEVIRWEEVRMVEEVVFEDHAPINLPLRRLIPAGTSRRFHLHDRRGAELAFDANTVRGIARFEAILRHAARVYGLRWAIQRADV